MDLNDRCGDVPPKQECNSCHQVKPVNLFRIRNSKPSPRCKGCDQRKMREYNASQKGKEALARYRAKCKRLSPSPIQVRSKVQHAIDSGKLVRPDTCEVCHKDRKIDSHHDDYRRPLKVKWLCVECHGERTKAFNEANPVQLRRLKRGWPISKAMNTPVRKFVKSGITTAQFKIAASRGISVALLRHRVINKHMSFDSALLVPVKVYVPFAERMKHA